MDKLDFSIIVPVYKVKEKYLHQCINSILEQAYPAFELILVDDGSPDRCGEICDEYAKKDSRVRVIHQGNQGVSVARNIGIQAAVAEWIWFVDSDDWIEPDALSILSAHISHKSDIDVLQFRAYLDYENGKKHIDCGVKVDYLYDLNIPEERLTVYRRVLGTSDNHSPAYYSCDKVFNRETLIKNSLSYPVGIPKSEDKVFFALCCEKINRLCTVPDFLYHYRFNAESVCHSYCPNLDKKRLELSEILLPIAKRMDEELAVLFNEPGFHQIYDDLTLFLFKVITDVLCLYFNHKENPNRKTWRRDAVRFLETEPFKSSIDDVPYSRLSMFTKIKKVMLKFRLVSFFCFTHTFFIKIRSWLR